MSELIRVGIYSAHKSSPPLIRCPVVWPWSATCCLSMSLLLCFSFYQQLLLPAKHSVTLQLSANKSSELLPAFSHPLSWPQSCFWHLFVLCLSIFYVTSVSPSSSQSLVPTPFLFFTTSQMPFKHLVSLSYPLFVSRRNPRG